MSRRIEELKRAIERMYRCKAVHLESERVIEMLERRVLWDGVVATFAVSGHPRSNRCFAWSFPEDGRTRYIAIMEAPHVISASAAVSAFVVSRMNLISNWDTTPNSQVCNPSPHAVHEEQM